MQLVSEPHFEKSWPREYEDDDVSMRVTINPRGLILSAKQVGFSQLAHFLDAIQ